MMRTTRRKAATRDLVAKPSLRIAVIGVGGIGSAFAFQLVRIGGHALTAIARPNSERLRELQRDNGIIDTKGQHAVVDVADTLDESIPYDLVIVTLLAHQVDSVLTSLQRSCATNIQFMFNNFEPERLRDIVGAERCSFGMPFIQALINNNGRLKATIGAGAQKTKMNNQRWVDVFVAADLPAVLEPDMLLWLRCHVPLCVAFESVSVAAMQSGNGASWKRAMALAHGITAAFALINQLGYQLNPGKARLDASPAWAVAAMLWFVSRIPSFRELLATGKNECRALVDTMLTNAKRSQLSAPLTAKIEMMKP